jgi:methionyl-tRNA synthetase
MTNKYFPEGVSPAPFEGDALDARLRETIATYDFKAYLETVWSIVSLANEKVDKEAPFKTIKTDPEAAKRTLSELVAMVRWLGKALQPIMPTTADEITRRYAGAAPLVGEGLFPRKDQQPA